MKRLFVMLTIAAALACGNKDKVVTDPDVSVAGSYTLQTLNGSSLPAPFDDDGTSVSVTAGSVTLNANGTFSYSETRSNGVDAVTGSYSQTGDTYTFVPTPPPGEGAQTNGSGTFSGSNFTLTVAEPGKAVVVRVYTKN